MPTLRRILAGPHRVECVVSQPDRRRGRGRRTSPSPVSQVALDAEVPLLRPEKAGSAEVAGEIRSFEPDLGVVVAFGQFLPRRLRELPRLGYLINAHASLLPALRGAAPIQHAILEGHRETGISIMRVEREMDAGGVALVRRTPIGAEETGGALGERLARIAADAVAEALDRAAADDLRFAPQDDSRATFAPKITRDDLQLDFGEPAEALARRVRALAPQPGAATTLDGETLRILRARACPDAADAAPGTVRIADSTLRIATGEGWLEAQVLQRAGKRALETEAFLRGRALSDGARLGSGS